MHFATSESLIGSVTMVLSILVQGNKNELIGF